MHHATARVMAPALAYLQVLQGRSIMDVTAALLHGVSNLISRLRAASLPFGQPQRQLARACVARDAILMLRASQITEPPIVTMLLKRRKPTAKRIERDYDRKPDSIDAP